MRKFLLSLTALVFGALQTVSAQTTDSYSGNVVADEGAWCWFADPRALHYENEDKSINATYIGYIDVHGSIKATQIDWTTNTTSEVLIRSWFQPDDHDNPAFLVLPDERIMIIYSRHTDEAAFYYRISKRPGDITCLGDEKRLATANNTTYPNPYILASDPDHIYMCWRGIGWHPTVAQMSMPDANDDIKFTWGPYQMVQSTGARPYAKYMSDGQDKIYLAYTTGHPDNEQPNWLYCNVFDVKDKCLYDMKGKKLSTVQSGTFKVEKTSTYKTNFPTTVVDSPSDKRDWIWNMAFAKDGNPVIGMTRINGGKTEHDYYYAKWDGSAWNVSFVANGGGQFHHTAGVEMCYSSGMAIDRDNPNIAYCGVPVEGTYGKQHEIWKYTLNDNGAVIAKEAVTKNSKKTNARPFVIEGTQNSPLRLSWMNGDYYYWIVSNAYPKGYPTAIMSDYALPVATTSSAGLSVSVDLSINQSNYGGKILTFNGVEYGLDASSKKPYLIIDGKKYMSQNVLGTADSWKNHSGTTDGTWPSISLLKRWNLTITYDQTNKRLTTYRNGIIDQQIDCELTATAELEVNEEIGAIYQQNTYTEALSQDRIKALVADGEMEAIEIPARATTDIVLPATVNNKDITWTSSNADVLSTTGIVSHPDEETEVTLTATVGDKTKEFVVTVTPRDIKQNVRAEFRFEGDDEGITLMGNAKLTNGKLDLTGNTATAFSTNGYAIVDEGLLKGLRSYTVLLTVKPKSLSSQPRLYDFGAASGNSVFLRANTLSAGIKYNNGTTTMVNATKQLTTVKEYKLAVTFDAQTKTTCIYVDGKENVRGTANQNEPYMIYEAAGDARNYIGRTQWWSDAGQAANNVDFVGTIDNFVVYDIALTQKEICVAQDVPFETLGYAKTITNGDFEGTYSKLADSGVSSDRAIYVPKGWTARYDTRNNNDLTALKSGDLYYADFFAPKPQNTNGGKQTMWIRQRWGTSVIIYSQTLCPEAGTYTVTADLLTADTSGKSYVFVNKQQQTASKADTWETVSFELETVGDEIIEIGVCSNHPDGDGERICGFDNITLTKHQEDRIANVTASQSSDNSIYDLSGRRVSKMTRGIYLVNNKKVVR